MDVVKLNPCWIVLEAAAKITRPDLGHDILMDVWGYLANVPCDWGHATEEFWK